MRPQKVIVKDNRSGTSALSCPSNVVRPDRYSCSVEIFDSMSMSRNSLYSKISRQSRHSTYSASSSRETTCTRGWIHCLSMDVLYRWMEVLTVGWFICLRNMPLLRGRGIVRYFETGWTGCQAFPAFGVLISWVRGRSSGMPAPPNHATTAEISDKNHRHSLNRSLLCTYNSLQRITSRCKGLQWSLGAS